MTMKRLVLHFFLLSMLSSPLLFAIDNLKLNSKLDYTSDSLDGPLITGDDAQSGFVPGKPNYVMQYYKGYIPHVLVLDTHGEALYNQSGEVDSEPIENIFEKALGH